MPALPVELFRRLTSGIYVITALHEERSDGFTAAWVMQASFDPLLLVVSVNPHNATWPLIQRSNRFVVNVLASGQQELARYFGTTSGRDREKLATIPTQATDGALWLMEAVAWIACRVEQQVPAGDHVLVVGRPVAGDILDPAATPLHYADTGNMDGSAALFPPAFPT